MIDGLEPYPAMKDSGVPWLGEVPAHWEVPKLKYAVSFSGGGTPSKADASFWNGHIPWISPKDMQRARITDATDHITDEAVVASATSLVPPGAVILVVRSGILRRAIPVAVNEIEVALNQDMKALRPGSGLMGEYLRALIQGNEAKLIREWTKQGATVESIEHEFLANSRVPLPPLPEQAAIVRFLDHADRRIRRYIRAKRKLIKLLEEQKQAIIHRAVTRGLDPDVRLKPSGVEWLGDVPEHWEVMPLRRASTSRCDGPFGSGLKSGHYTDHGIRVVRLQNIGHAEFRNSDAAYISPEYYATLGDHDVESSDLLIAGLGDERHPAGRACVAPPFILPAMVKADCFRFRPRRDRLASEFAALHLTATAIDASSLLSTGATRQRTNLQSTASRAVAVPPISEQRAIVQHIDSEMTSLLHGIRVAEREISLLREYRTRLIADVVTGKLDVRAAAARLSDETLESQQIDDLQSGEDGEAALEGLLEVAIAQAGR